jgi:hypothetical protein
MKTPKFKVNDYVAMDNIIEGMSLVRQIDGVYESTDSFLYTIEGSNELVSEEYVAKRIIKKLS